MRSPADVFGGLADTESAAELLKLGRVVRFGAVQVLALGNQLHAVVAAEAGRAQDPLEGRQVLAVHHEKLVLIELDFHRAGAADDGHAGAAIVKEKVLEVTTMALEDRQVNLLAAPVLVIGAFALVAGL